MNKVLIWGTGKIAEGCTKHLRDDVELIAYVQSDIQGGVSLFRGKTILSGRLISNIDYDYIILANTHEKEIVESFYLEKKRLVYWRAISEGACEDIHNLFCDLDEVYVSFGENCLADNLLMKYGMKSFATPYSHGRSNIEYINAIEQDGFVNLLKKSYLKYCILGEKKVVRNIYYVEQNNVYDSSVMNGFEFTHHDVINNEEYREQFGRRIKRISEIKDKNLYIFYHHRFCEETNEDELLNQLYNLYTRYSKYNKKVFVIMFTQKIIGNENDRKVSYELKKGIYIFRFYTLDVWAGNNDDVLAKKDDDLIGKMMDFIQEKKLEVYSERFRL